MTITVEVSADTAEDFAQALQGLATDIIWRENDMADAIDRRTLRSGVYETKTPAIRSLDIY